MIKDTRSLQVAFNTARELAVLKGFSQKNEKNKFNNENLTNSFHEENETDKETNNSLTLGKEPLPESLPEEKKEDTDKPDKDNDSSIPSFEKETASESLNKKDNSSIPSLKEVTDYIKENSITKITAKQFLSLLEEFYKTNPGKILNWKQELQECEKELFGQENKPTQKKVTTRWDEPETGMI